MVDKSASTLMLSPASMVYWDGAEAGTVALKSTMTYCTDGLSTGAKLYPERSSEISVVLLPEMDRDTE